MSSPDDIDPDGQGQFEFFANLPDEVVLNIAKSIETGPESLKAFRGVSVRFRRVAFMLITKVDRKVIQEELPFTEDGESILQFILNCSNLKQLSLIINDGKKVAEPLLDSIIQSSDDAKKVAKSLAANCPNIRSIEISGIQALRMVREYVRILNKEDRCQLEEVRTFSIQNFNTMFRVMREINQLSPKLNTFKLLQRDRMSKKKKLVVPIRDLWVEMSPKLTKFSTNIDNKLMLCHALSSLTKLERIVVWGLREKELYILCKSLVNLRILILMSVDLTGIHLVSQLKNLTELHIKVPNRYEPPDEMDIIPLQQEFRVLFCEIGSNLQKMSFNFRNTSTSHLLDSIPKYCTSLTELKFSLCADYSYLFDLAAKVNTLEVFCWNEDQKLETPHIPNTITKLCKKLFKVRPSLKKLIVHGFSYSLGNSRRNDTNIVSSSLLIVDE